MMSRAEQSQQMLELKEEIGAVLSSLLIGGSFLAKNVDIHIWKSLFFGHPIRATFFEVMARPWALMI